MSKAKSKEWKENHALKMREIWKKKKEGVKENVGNTNEPQQ